VNNSSRPYARAALVLLLGACSKGDVPRADSSTAAATTPPPPTAQLRATAKAMPGQLTKPLDTYTGDELYAFVHGLQYTADSVKERKCRNDPACVSSPTPKKIKVGVAAVIGQDSLSAGTTPEYGVVYVRATNQGNAEEARYGMKPGRNIEFYVVVLPDTGGTMKWRLEQLNTSAGSRQHTSIGTGPFISCNHAWVPGAKADFKTCANSAMAHDSVVKLGLRLQGGADDPIWVSCSGGCCTVGAS
jgi:hypothetical protein